MSLILARAADPSRKPFGKNLKEHDLFLAQIARLRIDIEAARLLVLNAADMIDRVGAKRALRQIAMAKVTIMKKKADRRLLCLRLLDACWIGQFKCMALKACVRTNYLLRCMHNQELCVLQMDQMKSTNCMFLTYMSSLTI